MWALCRHDHLICVLAGAAVSFHLPKPEFHSFPEGGDSVRFLDGHGGSSLQDLRRANRGLQVVVLSPLTFRFEQSQTRFHPKQAGAHTNPVPLWHSFSGSRSSLFDPAKRQLQELAACQTQPSRPPCAAQMIKATFPRRRRKPAGDI